MYPQVQRPRIRTLEDIKKGNFIEDKTIIWDTHYLVPIEVSNLYWTKYVLTSVL